MIRKKSEGLFFTERLVDQVIVFFCWIISYLWKFNGLGPTEGLFSWYLNYGILLILVSVYFFKNSDLYKREISDSLFERVIAQIKANAISFFVFVVIAFFLSNDRISRVMLFAYFFFSTFFLVVYKVIFQKYLDKVVTKAVIVGGGKSAKLFRDKVEGIARFEIIGDRIEDVREGVDLLIIGYDNKDYAKVEKILSDFNEELIPIVVLPDIQSSALGYEIQSFNGIPMIVYNEPKFKSFDLFLKRLMDIFLCSVGMIFISPLLLMLAVLVKLTSKGPIFYGQIRMGVDGKEFKMWKFRSMRTDSSNHGGWTVENDPRVTPIGKFMRRTSLDELPQLWNVIVGDMSLVGPRPERPQFVEEFKKDIPAYMLRHKMKAGITGWAQINGWRGDTSIAKRIECDLWYIKNWSLWLDVSIIFLTFWKGFVNKNAY